MKILHINAIYERLSTGRIVAELSEYLKQKGNRSFVAAVDTGSLTSDCYKIGTPADQTAHALLSRISGKQGFFSSGATKGLLKYIENIKPDVVHLNNLHSNYVNIEMLLKYLGKNDIPTVLTLHDNWFYTGKCTNYTAYNCNRWQTGCGNCPDVHFGNKSWFFDCSASVLKTKEELFSGIPRLAVIGVSSWVTEDAKKSILKNAKIIKRVYNWIDFETFKIYDANKQSELKKKYGLENKKVILGVAAFWSREKGIDVFENLADILPDDIKIALVGSNDLVGNKHPKIEYLGDFYSISELADIYNMADVYLNPTLQETFGKTTAEAMACGVPVVANDTTSMPELLGRDLKCGILIKSRDAADYMQAIKTVLSNGKEYYSVPLQKRVNDLFSKEKNLNEYLEIYNQII